MIKPLIEPKEDHDFRLKVLWIEDTQPAKLTAHTFTLLSKCFTVWRAWSPHELSDSLKKALKNIYSEYSKAEFYNLPDLPMDGYLADFDLSGGGQDAESRESSDDEYEIPDPHDGVDVTLSSGEVSGEVGLGDLALKAEAAGLTSAVLTALNFVSHPTVIVPYTGRPLQLSFQRALIRLLAPTSLIISRGSELDRGKISLEAKLQDFADDYRKNLFVWAGQDVVSIPSVERGRLQELAKSRAYGEVNQKQVKWEESDVIVVDTLYGRRHIGCTSLWFRIDGVDPSLNEVNKWLNDIPVPTPVYSAAVRLAYEYWTYSETDTSRYRYTLSRFIRSLKSKQPGSDAESIKSDIKVLCGLCGVDFDAAIQSPTRVKMGRRQYVPHLLNSDATEEVQRLAVFMLLTMEYAARWRSIKDQTDVLWKMRHIIDYKNAAMKNSETVPFEQIDAGKLNGVDMDRLKKIMADLGYGGLMIENGEIVVERLMVHDYDMAQRLDPLPEQLLTVEQNFSGERIWRALERVGIDLKALITDPDKGGMKPEERREIQYFALDIDYPRGEWPEWLRKT